MEVTVQNNFQGCLRWRPFFYKCIYAMIRILQKELKTFFSTSIGYIVIALFMLATGLVLWVFPGQSNIIDSGYANLDALFHLAPWLYLFLCPAVTMRMIAEERQTGTIELLLTKPISKWSIILGKLFAGWIVVIIALLPSLLWLVSVFCLAENGVDYGAFWGSWLGLLFLALAYLSVGLFGSTLSKNQIVVFIVSASVCFALYYGFELVGSLASGQVSYFLRCFGMHAHYESIARGVIDSRDIVYFLFVSFLFSLVAKCNLSKH